MAEAGAVILGGHTIDDAEPKYGLSVTGIICSSRDWTNAGAEGGDVADIDKRLAPAF